MAFFVWMAIKLSSMQQQCCCLMSGCRGIPDYSKEFYLFSNHFRQQFIGQRAGSKS